jgi:hypothetical protein
MKRLKCAAFYLLLVFLFSNCTVGRKMGFENKEVAPEWKSPRTVVISFVDKRDEVVSGKEKPTFCGHLRSSAQIGYNMQTSSGKPLAEDFTQSVTQSLDKKGNNVVAQLLPVNTSTESALRQFANHKRDRFLIFSINKWEASATPRFTTITYEVIYNLDLKVYDSTGTLLAGSEEHDITKKEEGDLGTSVARLQSIADEVFISKIKALLNAPAVKATLQ